MSFSKLPAELQIEIFGYLRNTDLKAVRCVNSACRDNASQHLFRSIIACARYKAMGAFQSVALHPVYQRYVKEILFDATTYNSRIAENDRAYPTGGPGWDRHGRWKRYQSLYREQQEIKEGVLLQTVARALQWMPQVESIVYCPYQLHLPVEKKITRDIVQRDLISRNSGHGASSTRDSSDGYIENGFHHLIGAICIAGYSNIHEFRVSREAHDGFSLPLKEFQFAEHSHLEAGKHFFRHLRRIDLDINMLLVSDLHECLATLRILLSEARDLVHLRLFVRPGGCMDRDAESLWVSRDAASPFASIGLATEWFKIQSIDLGHITATEDELKGLLERTKGRVSVKFTTCILTSGRWSNLVDKVVDDTKFQNFVLDRVHERFLSDGMPLANVPLPGRQKWIYEGKLKEHNQGGRYFGESPSNSIYAWRGLSSDGKDTLMAEPNHD